MKKTNKQTVITTTVTILILNLALSVLKLAIGLLARSAALVADAAHSFSDVLGTIIVITGVKLGGKQADRSHPYGHERLESAASLILSAVVLITGIMLGYDAIMQIIYGAGGDFVVPGAIALAAVVITVAAKEGMYRYTRAASKKTGSSSLMALAWDQRSDVMSSIGAFVGILGARFGLPILDPIAAVVISLLIIRVAINIFRDAMRKMIDTSAGDELEDEIRAVALDVTGVISIDELKTRLFGDRVYVDIEIGIDGDISLYEAHHTAQLVENAVSGSFTQVKSCMVHVNPIEDPRR